MKPLTLDASVFVSAAAPDDRFCAQSEAFLKRLKQAGVPIIVPAFARVEIACALSRILNDADRATSFTRGLYASIEIEEVPLSAGMLELALRRGSAPRLRGSDALYLATAELYDAELVSWDQEHITRAGAVSPITWHLQHPESAEETPPA